MEPGSHSEGGSSCTWASFKFPANFLTAPESLATKTFVSGYISTHMTLRVLSSGNPTSVLDLTILNPNVRSTFAYAVNTERLSWHLGRYSWALCGNMALYFKHLAETCSSSH